MHHGIIKPSAPRVCATQALRCLLAAFAVTASSVVAYAQIVVPTNAKATCTVSQAEFNSWFTSGSVTPNGVVDPADGLLFSGTSLCAFYKWSTQMFLWLTSPAPSRYGAGTHVFNSPVFYSVSPPDANGLRTLIPNSSGNNPVFNPFINQLGRQRQQVVFDSAGKIHNVIRAEASPAGNPVIRSKTGQPIEIGRLQVEPNGKPSFMDRSGRVIDAQVQNGNPILRDTAGRAIEIRGTIRVNGLPMVIDAAGNAIETEEGQAGGGGVLMSQGGSIVYYLLQVNDVYAYFLTGVKNNQIAATKFPISSNDMIAINAYASGHGKFLPDLPAMAVEVKSSWIDATGLANVGDYVTVDATIPSYTQVSPTQWNQTGTKQATLALVGMHVVGSVLGHAELLWATFEHVNNTPNAQYTYTTTANTTQTMPQNTVGNYLFTASGTSSNFNNQRMAVSSTGITGITVNNVQQTIGPSNLLRLNPWGTASTNSAFTANNTDIISLNNSIINKLAANDVRKKYFHAGTTWTANGQNPSVGTQVGTNAMANTTMETFFQGGNCFGCHSDPTMLGGPTSFPAGGLSHIYGVLKKLF